MKNLNKQMKKEEEQKDMLEIMERKFDQFEDKVKETIKYELKNHNLKTNIKNRFCQCGKQQKDCSLTTKDYSRRKIKR